MGESRSSGPKETADTSGRATTSLEAADRQRLAKGIPAKETRFPRTDRRRQRVAAVLARRQPDLTVVLEDVHDPHNVSAVLRSCDAVGVTAVHLVYVADVPPERVFARTTSASAAKWIETVWHESIDDCYAALREQGFTVLATAVSRESQDLYNVDLCRPIALVFGNEMRGVSERAVTTANGTVAIPMMGMVQSLNISVACAVVLYEALRQRRAAGHYDDLKLGASAHEDLLEEWLLR